MNESDGAGEPASDRAAGVRELEAPAPGAPRAPKRSLLRTTIAVGVAQIVFRGGEAVLPLLLAYWFGRNDAMDVYFFAWAVFSFAGALVFQAYRDSPLVPILLEEKLARPAGVPKLVGSLLMHTWVFGGALAVGIGALALGWFAFRYHGPSFTLAAGMVVPFTLYLVATATRTFFATLLSVEHQFVVQSLASGLGMAVNVAVLALGHAAFGVLLVPVAALAGEIVTTLLLAWFSIRVVGLRIDLGLSRPEALVSFAKLVVHQIGGGVVTRINPVVDQIMAGLSGVIGAGTMLRLTGEVALLPTSLLQAALLPVLLSHLADDFARRDLDGLRRQVVRSLRTVILLLVAATIAFHLLRGPVIRLVFLHGEMDAAGVDRMIELMPYHLVGLAPFGALLILARAHIALKNTGIFIGVGVLNAASNAIFNIVLLKAIGLEGIALATSLVHLGIAVLFWFQFDGRVRELEREHAAAAAAGARAETETA